MSLKSLLYPPRCPFCGKLMEREEPCAECLRNATELTAAVCRRCGAYPEDCSCGQWSYPFTRNVSCYLYEKSPRTALLRFKLRNSPQQVRFIGRRMYFHILARLGKEFSCVTYVPQSFQRTLKRRYNPTKILAEYIAGELGVPCKRTLWRVRGKQQKYLKGNDRWANARKSYKLRRKNVLSGKVLLIDDLFTTGATLSACAALLKEAGAEEVVCATFAINRKKS